jgi:hypothetical protein
VVLKEGSGDIREFEWVVNQKMKLPENDESGFRFWVGGTQEPGETRRDFGFPKNHCFRLHAHVPRVKLPENDESGVIFWVGGTQ